jgi:repressor LexA
MPPELTRRQQEILDFIAETVSANGMPPTRAEISRAFGFASPNAAESHLRALAQKGAIQIESGSARGIRLLTATGVPQRMALESAGLPLVGRVAAGAPILAYEHVERHYPVDPMAFSPRADFLLLVRGLSMINAGICEGDLLAVHRSTQAREGQIVVARIGDDVTVKRLKFRADGCIELAAENPDFSSIIVDPQHDTLAIEGIGVGLIRHGFPKN